MCELFLRIADLGICLHSDYCIKVTEPFKEFLVSDQNCDIRVNIAETSTINPKLDDKDYQGVYFSCRSLSDSRIQRFYYTPRDGKTYAEAVLDFESKKADVKYISAGIEHVSETGNSFFHIGWENFLAYENRLILHSCCVDTNYGGILFSGPSGIGKSTQGELWKKYEKSEVINGDRPILYHSTDGWYAYGSPYAGSSLYYVNKRTGIKSIVMLKQSELCSIRKLNAIEAFHKLYAMTTICVWDPKGTANICSLIERLIMDVPVYEMECTPDLRAIETLKSVLVEGNQNHE